MVEGDMKQCVSIRNERGDTYLIININSLLILKIMYHNKNELLKVTNASLNKKSVISMFPDNYVVFIMCIEQIKT